MNANFPPRRPSRSLDPRLPGYKLGHVFLTLLVYAAAWFLFRYGPDFASIRLGRYLRYDVFAVAGVTAVNCWLNYIFCSYTLGYFSARTLAFSQTLANALSLGMLYAAVTVGWWKIKSPLVFLPALALLLGINLLWSELANKKYYAEVKKYRTCVIYRSRLDLERFGNISGKPVDRFFRIEKTIPYTGHDIFDLLDEIHGYDCLFVAGVDAYVMNGLVKYCEMNGVLGFFLPHIGNILFAGAEHVRSFTSPVLSVRRAVKPEGYLFLKRAFDIFASAFGLAVLSPVLLLTAAAVKLYDGGPVFYKQTRLTKDGRRFKIIKFRSMRTDAEKDGKARLSTGKEDRRITPVGRVIRACRLAELPQLFNILIGDMSIVGPRPERPEIAEEYGRILPEFELRLQVKAGLTGYAQVYGKYNTSPYEKLEFDLMYINRMSLLTDLELMFNTARILFSKESTEGFQTMAACGAEEGEMRQ